MRGAITPFPNTPSWRGAQLKEAQGQLYLFTFTTVVKEELSSGWANRFV